MDLILPSTFLLEEDGQTLWGYVQVRVVNNVVAHLEFALKEEPTVPLTWVPFGSFTIVGGQIAYHIHNKEQESGNAAIVRGEDGNLYLVLGEEGRRVDASSSAVHERAEEPESDDPHVQHGEVGEDALDSGAARGQDPDSGD